MNKKDKEQLKIVDKKIDYLVKESSEQYLATLIGISIAYFAIATSALFSPYKNTSIWILLIGSYFAGVSFLIFALFKKYSWKKKFKVKKLLMFSFS